MVAFSLLPLLSSNSLNILAQFGETVSPRVTLAMKSYTLSGVFAGGADEFAGGGADEVPAGEFAASLVPHEARDAPRIITARVR
jgi:hypothetical protein